MTSIAGFFLCSKDSPIDIPDSIPFVPFPLLIQHKIQSAREVAVLV
jgi:hypothetical protein